MNPLIPRNSFASVIATASLVALGMLAPMADASDQGLGVVSYVNSGSTTVQADFLTGLAQLHNFQYSQAGGERAEVIYTLIGTAKLNELDPKAYLRYVLERIADHPITRIEELLPWNVAAKLKPLQLAA
jgi:hypothetical protein